MKIVKIFKNFTNVLSKGKKEKVFFKDDFTLGTIDLIDIKNKRIYVVLDEIFNEYEYQQVNGHPFVDYAFGDIQEIF